MGNVQKEITLEEMSVENVIQKLTFFGVRQLGGTV